MKINDVLKSMGFTEEQIKTFERQQRNYARYEKRQQEINEKILENKSYTRHLTKTQLTKMIKYYDSPKQLLHEIEKAQKTTTESIKEGITPEIKQYINNAARAINIFAPRTITAAEIQEKLIGDGELNVELKEAIDNFLTVLEEYEHYDTEEFINTLMAGGMPRLYQALIDVVTLLEI